MLNTNYFQTLDILKSYWVTPFIHLKDRPLYFQKVTFSEKKHEFLFLCVQNSTIYTTGHNLCRKQLTIYNNCGKTSFYIQDLRSQIYTNNLFELRHAKILLSSNTEAEQNNPDPSSV